MKIDLATVIYYDELNYLETQARSIELYFPRDSIGNIFVIVNQEKNKPLEQDNVDCIVDPAWYGINADKVKIIDYHEWGYTNYNDQFSYRAGWQNQQLCKLLISKEVQTEWYAVLDAKTWFINPVDLEQVFTNNKYNIRTAGWHQHFIPSTKSVELHFGIDLNEAISPGGVPFIFHTNTVLDMINYVETVAAPTEKFHDFFLARCRTEHPGYLTEFCLYTGYVIKKHGSIGNLYNVDFSVATLTPINIDVFNIHHCDVDLLLQEMRTPAINTVSVHRNAIPLLKMYQLKSWMDLLTERNLANSK